MPDVTIPPRPSSRSHRQSPAPPSSARSTGVPGTPAQALPRTAVSRAACMCSPSARPTRSATRTPPKRRGSSWSAPRRAPQRRRSRRRIQKVPATACRPGRRVHCGLGWKWHVRLHERGKDASQFRIGLRVAPSPGGEVWPAHHRPGESQGRAVVPDPATASLPGRAVCRCPRPRRTRTSAPSLPASVVTMPSRSGLPTTPSRPFRTKLPSALISPCLVGDADVPREHRLIRAMAMNRRTSDLATRVRFVRR